VPLRDSEGKIVGLVGISHDITVRKLAEEELTRRNAEMNTDLKVAREIQQSFLIHQYPTFSEGAAPSESALQFCHRYLPASSLAGDFFDIFSVSNTEAGILICDVMGHGIRAALITAFIRGLVEELMPLAARPGAFLSELNRALFGIFQQSESPFFVTTLYCVADIGRSQLRYANGGHPSPFLIRQSRAMVVRIRPDNFDPEPALGLIDQFEYSTCERPLTVGDRILAFTDGLPEVAGPGGTQLGEEWLHRQVSVNREMTLDDLFDHLLTDAKKQSGNDEFDDDVCLVGVQVNAKTEGEQPPLFED
jgi:sigma-B regulation protein RsbU (phosphoserine phosphatase)